MIAVGPSVLDYTHRREPPNHLAAAALMRGLAEKQTPWSILWTVCTVFLRIVIDPGEI